MKNKIKITKEQLALGLGGGLGDTWIDARNLNVRLKFNHGVKQSAYCEEKAKIFADFVRTPPKKSVNGGYGDFTISCTTITNEKLNIFRNLYLEKDPQTGKWTKAPNEKWLSLMDFHAFAFYYMDDGSLNGKRVRFNSHAYSYEQNEIILSRLQELGLSGKIYIEKKKDGRQYYFIELNTVSSREFLSKTRKYAHDSMLYKWALPKLKYTTCAICGKKMVETQYHRQAKYPSCEKLSCKNKARTLARKDREKTPEYRQKKADRWRKWYYRDHEKNKKKNRDYARKRRQDPKVKARLNEYKKTYRKRKKEEKEMLKNRKSEGKHETY
jgi:hypothetical protein